MFKKKNLFAKLYLKFTDKAKYKDYKWDLINYHQHQLTTFLTGDNKLNSLEKIRLITNKTGKLNLMHSGNAGDIIYALPTIKKIFELTGASINLYLQLGKPLNLPNYNNHALNNVRLNKKMVDMLIPLIVSQDYIETCEAYSGQEINIDLDYFRAGVVPTNGNIARWCSYITGVSPSLWKSWLSVKPDASFADAIVIARSQRYRNLEIDFSFLNKYHTMVFIGVKAEYDDMKKIIPAIKWIQVDEFLQLASIIAGCKLFIGNQSFPYSIAEALKVPRILEISYEITNVFPEGENGFDFFLQDHFEYLVNSMLAK